MVHGATRPSYAEITHSLLHELAIDGWCHQTVVIFKMGGAVFRRTTTYILFF